MKLRPFTARSAIIFVAVLLPGGIVLAEQKPGDCGYYVNSNGHRVPSPCGNARADAPPPRATAICRNGTYRFSEHPYASGTCSHRGAAEKHLR